MHGTKNPARWLPDCLQIVLIGPVPANVVILAVGAMAGIVQRSKSEKHGKPFKHNQKTQSGSRMVDLENIGKNRMTLSASDLLELSLGVL